MVFLLFDKAINVCCLSLELGLWTVMKKALILSRDLVHSNQCADGILWKVCENV